ncbi:MAG: cadherin domain-containing protein [Planctomycetaceae bacterium]
MAPGTLTPGTFDITITPVNDNAPIITSDGGPADAALTLAENITAVTTVTANDADLPVQTLTFSIAGGPDSALFSIDGSRGALSFATAPNFETPLDADSNNVYEVIVEVNDGQGLTSQQTIRVTITDVDEFDVTPIIDVDLAADNINENVAVGTSVGITTFAEDFDGTTSAVAYSLDNSAGGLFAIDSATGVVTTAATIDYETVGSALTITVRATSQDGSSVTQDYTITVNDLDEFDVTPIVDTNAAADNIDENVAVGTVVGITAFSQDPDGTTNGITYSLDNTVGGLFVIDSATGIVTTAAPIDFETVGSALTITVRATSQDGSTTTQDYTISVNDLDEFDVTPVVDTNAAADNIDENVVVGTVVGITAFSQDLDGTNNGIIYSLDNTAGGLFAIDSATGIVTTAAAIDYETVGSALTITVRATSQDGSTTTQDYTITVNDLNDNAPVILPGQMFAVSEFATVGTSLGHVLALDVDSVGSLQNWTITGGNTDGIFAINSATGELTIVSTTNLNFETTPLYSITVRATSQDGSTTTQDYTITVNDLDEFDVTPIVDTNAAADNIDENVPVGTIVGITAFSQDQDGTNNGITYSLDNTAGGMFAIDSVTGVSPQQPPSITRRSAVR